MIADITSLTKDLKLRIVYFSVLMIVGYWISPLWPLFLAIWLGISLFWSYLKLDQALSNLETKIYNSSLYLYPIIGSLIKVYIFINLFPETYFWVNRLEHTLWSTALVVLLMPFWKSFSFLHQKFSKLALFLIILGVVCLFGNMVEFVEYSFRFFGHLDYKYALYYPDTIYDMVCNIVGATLGFCIIFMAGIKKLSISK